jgi:hypothetical protein
MQCRRGSGGGGGPGTPCSRPPTFVFQQTCELRQKNRSEYSMDTIYLNLLPQNNSASCQTSTCLTKQQHIILRQNCTVRILASKLTNFLGRSDPRSGDIWSAHAPTPKPNNFWIHTWSWIHPCQKCLVPPLQWMQ